MSDTARMKSTSYDLSGFSIADAQACGHMLDFWQRGVNWWIGDLARYAKYTLKLGDNYSQVFPEWMSPRHIQSCEGVAGAFPPETRNEQATWSQHMRVANKPDRVALVAEMVERGETSDESRERLKQPRPNCWILAVDVNYYVHRLWHSGGGIESAMGVASWLERLVKRLQKKGLTDVLCCFDDKANHRKELTAEWEHKYKDRPPKDPELGNQIKLAKDLLTGHGFACLSVEGMEGDDIMASVAANFDGQVTLLTQDKDCRQCLSGNCNILLDVEWLQDDDGNIVPDYNWMSAKRHQDETGISPSLWTEYQTIMGDNVDGIKGAVGIGKTGAKHLIETFGSAEAAIEAAKAEDERIKPRQRKALMDFEPQLEVTRKLVTLRTDLEIPSNTRI